VTDTLGKALEVNLDPTRYGTFAEIGAGQEVVRWFFRAGGTAGTIAMSISAYDMTVSDVLYGEAQRYVSRERLEQMLAREHALNLERLRESRQQPTAFFAFADTVAAQSYLGTRECHAWMGVRFQAAPGAGDSQVVLHVRLLDRENVQQQEALGIVGVNLVHAAFHHTSSPRKLVEALLDGLSTERIEIDLIDFSGEAFKSVDNRLMALKLVSLGLTPVAVFNTAGKALQVSEVLYRRPVLVQRGRFRPPTLTHLDIQRGARARFAEREDVREDEIVSVVEMTVPDLEVEGRIEVESFMERIELLAAGDFTVLVSDDDEYYTLVEYLARSTNRPISIAVGLRELRRIFDPARHADLAGGVLEAVGRLFKNQVTLYAYPELGSEGEVVTAAGLHLQGHVDVVYHYLVDEGSIADIETFDRDCLRIESEEVIDKIQRGEHGWEGLVTPGVASLIRNRGLLGHGS
jgi:hypothetical protein